MEMQDNKPEDNSGSEDNKAWFVVHAYSGFEKSVAQALRDRIVRTGMEARFGDVLVPTEEVVEMRSGQKRRSERKFFPATCWCRSPPTTKAASRASTARAGT